MAEYIEREAAIAKCREITACEWNHRASPVSWADAYEQFAEDIEELPSADVVPVVHGRWDVKWYAERDPKRLFVRIVCSNCGLKTGQKSNYCPNCGARMDKEDT